MILVKDNIKRELTNKEVIKLFKQDGWVEVVEKKEEQPKEPTEKIKKNNK